MSAQDIPLATVFIAEARRRLDEPFRKMLHCLEQLPEEDLWWRPHPTHNAVGNIVLHVCGNLRQWIISGVGGSPDIRNRPAEFAQREGIAKRELIDRLTETVREAGAVLAGLAPERIVELRRIQGVDGTVLAALFNTLAHFEGHAHQLAYIARMRLGETYRFSWQPATLEEGAPAPPV